MQYCLLLENIFLEYEFDCHRVGVFRINANSPISNDRSRQARLEVNSRYNNRLGGVPRGNEHENAPHSPKVLRHQTLRTLRNAIIRTMTVLD
jgi:hypothetical protein